MAKAKKKPTYRERVNSARQRLHKEGSNFQEWARANGYKASQVYVTTRRYEPSKFGTSHEIAEKLGLLGD